MYEGRKVAVLIMAAGHGTRMGEGRPKQYRELGGVPILERTLFAFVNHPAVDDVLLVVSPEERDAVAILAVKKGRGKVQAVVSGGPERADSVWNGLRVLNALREGKGDLVLIQDAARPFATAELIDRVLENTVRYGAAVPCVTPKDTVKLEKEEWVRKTLPRERLASAQTPQGFDRAKLARAMETARKKGFRGTDDASCFERYGGPVRIVEGDDTNIKITTPEDMAAAEMLAEHFDGPLPIAEENFPTTGNNGLRVGEGTDVHMLVPNRDLVLGGVTVPCEKGLLGHSDADVLTHAVMDALLGAAGLGDIGKLFPDNDPAYENAYSMALLEVVRRLLAKKKLRVGNVDATVLCQAPKLAPHIPQMRKNLAKILRVSPDAVNVKATTTERLGFVGRGEGIAAHAIVTLLAAPEEKGTAPDLSDPPEQHDLPQLQEMQKDTGWTYLTL